MGLNSLIIEWKQKEKLSKENKSVMDELKDKNSLRFKANAATKAAVAHAAKDKIMDKATSKANEAKSLFAQMVEEKVKMARARYLENNGKKSIKVTEATVQKEFKDAKDAQEKWLGEAKRVKADSVKVAKENEKVTQEEAKSVKLEKEASKKEEKHYRKERTKLEQQTKVVHTKVKTLTKTVTTLQKEVATAETEVQKVGGMDLKALLAQAGSLLNDPLKEETNSEDETNSD